MQNTTPSHKNAEQIHDANEYPENHKGSFKKMISDRIFLCTVIIPTIIAIIYYTFIASGIYTSESKFIVRAQSKDSSSGMPSSLSGVLGSIGGSLGGLSTSQNDALTAENYIASRDAMNILNNDLEIIKIYSSSSIDRLHRFGGLRFWDKSKESFFDYYTQDIIGIRHEFESGISTLTVKAFDPDTAYHVNLKLNEISEGFINKVNDRARQDMLSFSEKEVGLAKKKVEEINQKIFDFRRRDSQSNISSNQQITYYQQLASEKEFADRNLTLAISSMDQARIEAMKKRLYLEKISGPNKPDMAMEPKRIKGIFTVLIVGLLLWGMLSLIISGVKEHHQ